MKKVIQTEPDEHLYPKSPSIMQNSMFEKTIRSNDHITGNMAGTYEEYLTRENIEQKTSPKALINSISIRESFKNQKKWSKCEPNRDTKKLEWKDV
jgi:hypothetical protein